MFATLKRGLYVTLESTVTFRCVPRAQLCVVSWCVVSQQSFGVLDAAVLDDDILALAKTQSDRVAVRSAFKRVCVA